MPNSNLTEKIIVEDTTVACDGGGALGHPRVFLSLKSTGEVGCPYCDRKFALKSPDLEKL